MKRIGVFLCECGLNIARTVNVDYVVSDIKRVPGIILAAKNKYLCSEPGQTFIRETIRQAKLDHIIIAACSPTLHESTVFAPVYISSNTIIAVGYRKILGREATWNV